MESSPISVRNKMESRLERLLPGSVVFAQDFKGDGSNESIRQHLVHFTKTGALRRLSQGVYLLPKKLGTHGNIMPTPEEIAQALARRDRARIIPTGEVALWKLGLSTQVPLNHVYLTDGPSRVIEIDNSDSKNPYTIRFKLAAPKNFAYKGKISSLIIQALKAIGEKNLDRKTLDKIESLILRDNVDDLTNDLSIAPAWISKLIKNTFNMYRE